MHKTPPLNFFETWVKIQSKNERHIKIEHRCRVKLPKINGQQLCNYVYVVMHESTLCNILLTLMRFR